MYFVITLQKTFTKELVFNHKLLLNQWTWWWQVYSWGTVYIIAHFFYSIIFIILITKNCKWLCFYPTGIHFYTQYIACFIQKSSEDDKNTYILWPWTMSIRKIKEYFLTMFHICYNHFVYKLTCNKLLHYPKTIKMAIYFLKISE